jgi:uncharacterized protein DUF397
VAAWALGSVLDGPGQVGGCVEVALLADGAVAVRDTKDRTLPPHLFTPHEWACFLTGVRSGEFDRP